MQTLGYGGKKCPEYVIIQYIKRPIADFTGLPYFSDSSHMHFSHIPTHTRSSDPYVSSLSENLSHIATHVR